MRAFSFFAVFRARTTSPVPLASLGSYVDGKPSLRFVTCGQFHLGNGARAVSHAVSDWPGGSRGGTTCLLRQGTRVRKQATDEPIQKCDTNECVIRVRPLYCALCGLPYKPYLRILPILPSSSAQSSPLAVSTTTMISSNTDHPIPPNHSLFTTPDLSVVTPQYLQPSSQWQSIPDLFSPRISIQPP